MNIKRKYIKQFLTTLVACLTVLSVGCTVGWTTPILKKLRKPDSEIPITKDQESWVASCHEVGHFLSPIPTGYLLARFGRIYCLHFANLVVFIGWIIILSTRSIDVLYFVRFLFGLSMGIVFTTVPLYVAEISSSEIRGALSTCFQACLYLGHLIEFCAGPYVTYSALGWISLGISSLYMISGIFLPESPLFLVQKYQTDRAIKAISWLENTCDDDIINEELANFELMAQERSMDEHGMRNLFSKSYRTKVLTVIMVAISQRFTGMSAIVAYAASTFPSTSGGLNSDQYTMLFGALVFLFTFVSAALLDTIGRRPSILLSCSGCAVFHFITAIYFYINPSELTWIPFVTISTFSVLYSLGLGPLVNTLQGEMFPTQIKGIASSAVTVSHAASSFIVTKLFQVIKDNLNIYVNFIFFGISCTISCIFAYYLVPETKRKTLREVEEM